MCSVFIKKLATRSKPSKRRRVYISYFIFFRSQSRDLKCTSTFWSFCVYKKRVGVCQNFLFRTCTRYDPTIPNGGPLTPICKGMLVEKDPDAWCIKHVGLRCLSMPAMRILVAYERQGAEQWAGRLGERTSKAGKIRRANQIPTCISIFLAHQQACKTGILHSGKEKWCRETVFQWWLKLQQLWAALTCTLGFGTLNICCPSDWFNVVKIFTSSDQCVKLHDK